MCARPIRHSVVAAVVVVVIPGGITEGSDEFRRSRSAPEFRGVLAKAVGHLGSRIRSESRRSIANGGGAKREGWRVVHAALKRAPGVAS